jgi:cellulose synthase/poly-beta-1,6-N-acetylglucosamine synthase-like glycosyltransferase
MTDFLQELYSILSIEWVQIVILIGYTLGSSLIVLYSIGQFHLLYIFYKKQPVKPKKSPDFAPHQWPHVTVQIPMFNELYVAESVIDACAKLDYPTTKLEIQVLDDSTDETTEIAQKRCDYWVSKGVDIVLIHRVNRRGFKAGALHEGTQIAKGEFIAIFDADFRPNTDFLKKTVGYFQDPKVGVVQTRWGHINRDYNLLTRAQSLVHDAFFMVEQHARSLAGYFLRFNGSGGLWRKSTIADAGNWSGETLSEDFDLCLRAQMKGWTIAYDNTITAPAELPVTMVDFKTQQYRWTKGRGQVIKKHLGNLMRAPLTPMVKAHAIFDMLNVFINIGVILLALFSLPLIFMLQVRPDLRLFFSAQSFALLNVLIAPWFSWLVVSHYADTTKARFKEMTQNFFPFLLLIISFPFFMGVSLIDGFINKKSFFHRTAKYNITEKNDRWQQSLYRPNEIPLITWMEGVLGLFFLACLALELYFQEYAFVPFHILLSMGFMSIFWYSIRKQ